LDRETLNDSKKIRKKPQAWGSLHFMIEMRGFLGKSRCTSHRIKVDPFVGASVGAMGA
jgi:hypothetical protein